MFADPTFALIAAGAAALVILIAGTRMSAVADMLADRTGFGEALVGVVLLGASTSFSGTVTSITAAAGGHAELAVSNAVGGIAAQTFFLAVADLFYRKANLEHAAATETILLQAGLLIMLLALPAIAMVTPAFAPFAIHPVTPLLVVVYVFGLRITGEARARPMWRRRQTDQTRDDEPDEYGPGDPSARRLALSFAFLFAVLGVAGWALANAAVTLSLWAGLSQSLVGALFTAVTTSLPELVTTVAAVRRGALQLAVGGIIGGNTFDVLFLSASDIAYREGSIFHAVGERELFLLMWGTLMTAIVLLGLIRRERRGPAGIGLQSAALVVVFVGGAALLAVQG